MFNPLTTDDERRRQILAACYQLIGTIRFEDRFCASRKGGTGGGGWVHRSAWQRMVVVAAACRKTLVNAGCAICLLSCTNGRRKRSFHLVGTPFLAI